MKFIELPFSAVTAAVLAKRIDAGVSNAPYLKDDVRAGKVRALGDLLGALGPHFLETAWVSTTDYIAKNRDAVARFVRVIHDAQVWCNAHVAEAGDLTSAYTGIDRATVAATKTIFATESDPREMQPYVTACAKYDIIPKSSMPPNSTRVPEAGVNKLPLSLATLRYDHVADLITRSRHGRRYHPQPSRVVVSRYLAARRALQRL